MLMYTEMAPDAAVVTIFPDDNKKYLSTDLLRDESAQADYLTPDIDLFSVRGLKRVCHTCCDPAECLEATQLELMEAVPLTFCARRG